MIKAPRIGPHKSLILWCPIATTTTSTIPTTVMGYTILFGSRYHLRSYTVNATNITQKPSHTTNWYSPSPVSSIGHHIYEITNSAAVAASTSGYCHEIGFPQYRHLPRSHNQLSTGTRSFAANSCLQLGHMEWPF